MTRTLVLVKWVDSYGASPHWESVADLEPPEVLYARSVGFVVGETDTCLLLVPHLTFGLQNVPVPSQGCGDMTIPKCAIVERVELGSYEF